MEDEIRSLIRSAVRGETLENEPLARHTSLRVGGPADIFAIPADTADLGILLGLLGKNGVPFLVIGGGCNMLARDGGFRGAVISLRNLSRLERLDGCRVRAEAGVSNGTLARFAAEKGLSGIEFLAGIPGTLGGALAMNAGAHGASILELVEELTTVRGGEIENAGRDRLDYGYRFLSLEDGEIILAATLRMVGGEQKEIEERMGEFLDHRRNSQQVGYPNAGSFFRNPEGMHAWRLIEEAGLKGYGIGGAQVSQAHANFLVNVGGAKAADFLELAGIIREKVKALSGVDLEEEVRIIGED